MKTVTLNDIDHSLPPRDPESHKGDYGRLLLIGGNENMGGAIIMAAKAAVSSGAGLTTVATAQANHTALHCHLPEAMLLDWTNEAQLIAKLREADVVLIGCGFGLEAFSARLLRTVLENLTPQQKLILDGDAITLFAKFPQSLKCVTLVTPHQKEWERLSGLPIARQNEAENRVQSERLRLNAIVKKHGTEIYFLGQEALKIDVGTPAMAVGGMGDTLAGMVAGFAAQFPHHYQNAVIAAVYLHSHIAERLAKSRHVVLPTDIIALIQTEMKKRIG